MVPCSAPIPAGAAAEAAHELQTLAQGWAHGSGAAQAPGHLQDLSLLSLLLLPGLVGGTGRARGCSCSKLLPFSRYQRWVPRLEPAWGTRDKQRTRVATQHFPAMQRCVGEEPAWAGWHSTRVCQCPHVAGTLSQGGSGHGETGKASLLVSPGGAGWPLNDSAHLKLKEMVSQVQVWCLEVEAAMPQGWGSL